MNHPTPQERLDLLDPSMQTEPQIAALLEVEKRSLAAEQLMCGCGRRVRRTLYCSWCWREMLGLLRGWQ